MEEKKEYIAPEMNVVDMEYTQMLCGSGYGSDCEDNTDPNCGGFN